MQKGWKLNDSQFTFWDRLKICKFFLSSKNKWTQGPYVKKYEQAFKKYIGCRYAVMFSSGSTANFSIAQYQKHKNKERNIVVVPAVTWATSVSPWIINGFEVKYLDINLNDFSINLDHLEKYLEKNHKQVAYIFPTSLIGFCPNVNRLQSILSRYNIDFGLDNCEAALSSYYDKKSSRTKHICSFTSSSISTYFGHHTTSVEGGFVFTNSEEEYHFHLMNRSHGMTRSLKDYGIDPSPYRNKLVDPSFDFKTLGSNFRASDIEAFIGLLDFDKINENIKTRKSLYEIFKRQLTNSKYLLPKTKNLYDVPFCLPIIFRNEAKHLLRKAKKYCDRYDIEYRQIISGNLTRQTVFHEYDHYKYKNAEYLHKYGMYVGLHQKVKENQLINLINFLNSL